MWILKEMCFNQNYTVRFSWRRILIGWIPFYDTGETSFLLEFTDSDIVTPINVNAFAFTQGIQLKWDPTASCSELENSRSSMNINSEKKHF